MAAKGAVSKDIITKQILDTFAGSFINDKEIRIPMIEDGAEVQIKVVLTCAKTNVNPGDDVALPGETSVHTPVVGITSTGNDTRQVVEPTAEEKAKLSQLLQTLGL